MPSMLHRFFEKALVKSVSLSVVVHSAPQYNHCLQRLLGDITHRCEPLCEADPAPCCLGEQVSIKQISPCLCAMPIDPMHFPSRATAG